MDYKFTGYVTVRLQSQRLPQKSIKSLGQRGSLIGHCIKTLNEVNDISNIIITCSNKIVQNYINSNFSYRWIERDPKLDSNDTVFNDLMDSVLDDIHTDYIVSIECTSPFLKVSTIQDIINHIKSGKYDSGFTATEAQTFCWYNNKPLNFKPSNIISTQDLKPVLVETSGLYIFSKETYKKHKRRVGFKPYIKIVNPIEGWDIDTPNDFKMAQIIQKGYEEGLYD